MKQYRYALLLLMFAAGNAFASYTDSAFICDVKQFIYKESGLALDSFYSTWKEGDEPYVILYASLKYEILRPPGSSILMSYKSEAEAKEKEKEFTEKGCHTFIYKTYAVSTGRLNARFISYPAATKSFIILHEFLHNYISKMKPVVPYDFNEAMADVVGNYGTLEYLRSVHSDRLDSAEKQTVLNEKLYKIMNRYIRRVNSDPYHVDKLNQQCEKKIKKILLKADPFQKDRFDYHVNNAYLLKNSYYSANYFLLKKLFLKQKTVSHFFRILAGAPSNGADFRKYIKQYI